jgi:hypothetical protein
MSDRDTSAERPRSIEVVAGRPVHEGSLRRATVDTSRRALTFWFLACEAVTTALSAAVGAFIVADPSATTLVQVLVAAGSAIAGFLAPLLVLFLASLARASFRQRDEAREELERVDREANPEFPVHRLQVDAPSHFELEAPAGMTANLLFIPIAFTNRDPKRRLSLQIDLLWRGVVGDHALGPFKFFPFRPGLFEDALAMPLAVEPATTVDGRLVFQLDLDFMFVFGEYQAVAVKENFEVFLRLTDHVTGAMIEHPIAAAFISSDA